MSQNAFSALERAERNASDAQKALDQAKARANTAKNKLASKMAVTDETPVRVAVMPDGKLVVCIMTPDHGRDTYTVKTHIIDAEFRNYDGLIRKQGQHEQLGDLLQPQKVKA